ncbi:hypothetical protein GGP41_002860 [Bipolaris sorokiniana]|uniref:Uncharacterized protein n=1 Tax=Cochliobolus sativus TaxID=45130 RepID=A0A8H6DR27_COCSA|nr:hypothetical protein GGP41_002860 [Bipolaris sorokiniana]
MAAATADNLAVLGFSDILNQNVAEREYSPARLRMPCIYWVWNCIPPADACVDSDKLETAWRAAALEHPIYATIFALDDTSEGFLQVVLRNPTFSIQQITTKDGNMTAAHIPAMRPRPKWTKASPRHMLTICTNVATGQVACRFDICHTLYCTNVPCPGCHETSAVR